VPFDDVPRQCVTWAGRAAVAGWSGQVSIVEADGSGTSYRLGSGLTVPGTLCPDGDRLYAGMWSGQVWALDPGSGTPAPVLRHDAGVQAMALIAGRFLIVGFDGRTAWYAATGEPASAPPHLLEPVVWGIRAHPGFVIVAGAGKVHRLDEGSDTPISLSLLPDAVGALVDGGRYGAVYNRAGRVVWFDAELAVRAEFQMPADSRPVGTDSAGAVLVTAYPDGSGALLVDDRVVHVNRNGPLAISPDGTRLALVEEFEVRTVPLDSVLPR
jgi:hypothetical protein